MGSKTATADRNRQREANTAQLMQNIMTGGEISKAKEAELQKAANAGRGVQYLAPNPYVKGLTQKGGQPVLNPNGSFTGRIVANAPTLGELGGDIMRGLFGGQAPAPKFTQSTKVNAPSSVAGPNAINYAGYTPAPERVPGLIPTVAEKFLVPGGIVMGIAKDLYQKYFPGQQEQTTPVTAASYSFPTLEPTTPVVSMGEVTREDIPSLESQQMLSDIDQGLEQRRILDDLNMAILQNYISQSQAPGSAELDVSTMSPAEIQMRLQSAGLYANGGLTNTVPPARGPMSEGVASLFKYK